MQRNRLMMVLAFGATLAVGAAGGVTVGVTMAKSKPTARQTLSPTKTKTAARSAKGTLTGTLPATGGSSFVGGKQDIVVSKNKTVLVQTLSVRLPTAGKVVVNASGTAVNGSGNEGMNVTCAVTDGTTLDTSAGMTIGGYVASQGGSASIPFAGTRGFDVQSGGVTFRLHCFSSLGATIRNPQMTAVYTPG